MPDISRAESQIREIIQNRVDSTRAKDAKNATQHFAEDAVIFDVVDPLHHHGTTAALQRARDWFSTFDGPIGFDIDEIQLTVGEGAAFSSSLNHVRGTTASGVLDMWWRCTMCYGIVDGAWKIVHEHNSVPFDPATGKASLDLHP